MTKTSTPSVERKPLALEAVNRAELEQVEGGVVTAAAVAGAVAIGVGTAVGVVAAGALVGWGLYELIY